MWVLRVCIFTIHVIDSIGSWYTTNGKISNSSLEGRFFACWIYYKVLDKILQEIYERFEPQSSQYMCSSGS